MLLPSERDDKADLSSGQRGIVFQDLPLTETKKYYNSLEVKDF